MVLLFNDLFDNGSTVCMVGAGVPIVILGIQLKVFITCLDLNPTLPVKIALLGVSGSP